MEETNPLEVTVAVAVKDRRDLRRLRIASKYSARSLALGASVSHDGVCLTIVAKVEPRGPAVYLTDLHMLENRFEFQRWLTRSET